MDTISPELIALIASDIPRPEKRIEGFLDIIQKRHDENINSRLYAYFLDAYHHPSLSETFLSALQAIIERKTERVFELEEFTPILEEPTSIGNRIDLVLLQKDGKKAIIIENKIYHHLHNDLKDYWNHYRMTSENKIGILLTLHRHYIPDHVKDCFINITHLEWINEIKSRGMPFDLDPRTFIYLADFFSAIQQLSKIITMDEQAKFYFQHAAKVREAIRTSESATNYIVSEIQKVAAFLEWKVYGSSGNWRNIWDANKDRKTFYTVTYDGFLNGTDDNYLILEMQREDLVYLEEVKTLFPENEIIQQLHYNGKLHYMHFFVRKIDLPPTNPQNLSEYILKDIEQHFEPMMQKILPFMDQKRLEEEVITTE